MQATRQNMSPIRHPYTFLLNCSSLLERYLHVYSAPYLMECYPFYLLTLFRGNKKTKWKEGENWTSILCLFMIELYRTECQKSKLCTLCENK